MFWIRFIMVALGLLICAAAAPAGEIDRRTDNQGTVHITTPKPDKATEKGTDKAAEPAPDEGANKVIYRDEDIMKKGSRPRSRRPVDPSSSYFGGQTQIRPSPYAPPPPKPGIGTPSPPPAATPAPKSPPAPGGQAGDAASSPPEVPAGEVGQDQGPPGN